MEPLPTLDDLRAARLQACAALAAAGKLPFKPESSAKRVNVEASRFGGIKVQIEHDDLAGGRHACHAQVVV